MDRIEIKSADIELLLAWRDKYPDLVRTAPAPLKAVEIVVKDTGYRIKGIRDGNKLRLTCFAGFNKLIDLRAEHEWTGLWRTTNKQLAEGMKEDDVQSIVTVYSSIMALMTFGERSVVKAPDPPKKKGGKKPHNRAKSKKAQRGTYILRTVGDALYAAPTGSHASPTGVFTVRGHYRHYKNGKVVWIAEYKKGTGKRKKKTYRMGEADRSAVKQIEGGEK